MSDPQSEHAAQPFANFQYEIYGTGLSGETPKLPVAAAALEAAARERLTPEAFGYVAGGAGSELTMAANLEAFQHWQIVPRMLRDVSVRDLRTRILGTDLAAPVLLAPVGVQSIVHPDGELAVARAAAAQGIASILSTAASNTIEDVAAAAGSSPCWYQLYWPRERELAASFVARAAAAGYEAVVVTLDTWILGWRPRDLQQGYLPFLKGEGVANYFSDPVFQRALPGPVEENFEAAIGHWAYQFSNPTVTWDDLAWLRDQTDLPIVLKGILHAEDAGRAVQAGADGLIVSNHGAARSTARSVHWMPCNGSARRSGRRSRSCSTAGSGRARMCSRHWPSARTPSASGGPTSGASVWTGRRASNMCSAACWPTSS